MFMFSSCSSCSCYYFIQTIPHPPPLSLLFLWRITRGRVEEAEEEEEEEQQEEEEEQQEEEEEQQQQLKAPWVVKEKEEEI